MTQTQRQPLPTLALPKDLISLLKTWKYAGESIILVGDLNKPLVPYKSNMAKVVHDIDLIKVFHHRHPHLPAPATYILGSHHIDYALISQDLCTSITVCSYAHFITTLPPTTCNCSSTSTIKQSCSQVLKWRNNMSTYMTCHRSFFNTLSPLDQVKP
jgi:hypothetical protein